MLKRIPVNQLVTGMFLHELCGSWMDHPFWRTRFLLTQESDIRKILDSGVSEVWINTEKGKDVDSGVGVSQEDAREQAERDLVLAATSPLPLIDLPDMARSEAERAAEICGKAKGAVMALFREARMGKAIDAGSCMPLVDEINQSVMRDPGTLISLARLKNRDEYTYMHSVAVCALMVALGKQLGFSEEQCRQAGLAGMLHDVGKAVIPLSILNKPDRLTDEEFRVIRTHPERGHALLVEGKGTGMMAVEVCLHHHEKIDGSGYPHRLPADRISLFAKMGAVCDVYDAVTSERPYKRGWDPAEALRQMAQWKGHFDPVIFQAFVKTVGIYPIGSLVRLQSQRLAVVLTQNPTNLLSPKVKAFFNIPTRKRFMPEEIDLASPWCQDKIVGVESPDEWKLGSLDHLWVAQPELLGRR